MMCDRIGLGGAHSCRIRIADVDATMATLTGDPVVVHVPTLMGARAARPVHRLYADHFIGHMSGDMGLGLVSRTATLDQIVDEMTISFTHNVETPWVLPGVAPTDAEWWCRSWQWSVCVTVSSTASTSTGIRHRSSRRSGCSIRPVCRVTGVEQAESVAPDAGRSCSTPSSRSPDPTLNKTLRGSVVPMEPGTA